MISSSSWAAPFATGSAGSGENRRHRSVRCAQRGRARCADVPDVERVVDINALRPLACPPVTSPSGPQARPPQPRWSRRHSERLALVCWGVMPSGMLSSAAALLALVRLLTRSSLAAVDLESLALTRGARASGGRDAVPASGAPLASPSNGTSHRPRAGPRSPAHARTSSYTEPARRARPINTKQLEPEAIDGGLAGP